MSAGRTAAEIEGAVDVTVPGVLEPGTELVIKNEGDRPHARRCPTRTKY